VVAARQRTTRAEYLAFERSSPTRHEYYSGEIWAMTGASREHNLICASVSRVLGNQLVSRPCEVYQSDMRVWIPRTEHYAYPDVVVCGEPTFEDSEVDTLLNPTLIVEVLSPSTEPYDRKEKFEGYQTINSLHEYLMIDQRRVRVEHYLRYGEKWLFTATESREVTLELPTINCTLSLADVYEKVRFEQPESG
jgi:Uma2 family endonuclease